MKRCFALLLVFSLLFSGCGIFGERIKEPVTFYYVRSEYQEDMSNVIASEEREGSGHTDDLAYLLALYLMGPSDEELVSPLPKGTRIFSAAQKDGTITLQLSDTTETMSDIEFSLACACLSLTCLDLTEAQAITINSGARSVTMGRDTLTLLDNNNTTTEETK